MVTSIAITLIVTGYVLAKSELRKWIRSEVAAKAELLEKVTTDVGAKLQRPFDRFSIRRYVHITAQQKGT